MKLNRSNSAAAEPLRGARLLLAEDTSDSRQLLTIVLRKAGAEVTAVDNGQTALELSLEALRASRPFDALVLDMAMPILSGYETAQRLRAEGYTGAIVALTAHILPGHREKCLEAGCDDYVGKPVDRHALVETVSRHVQRIQATADPAPANPPGPAFPAPEPKPAKTLLESLPEPQRAKLLKDFVDGLVERTEKMDAAMADEDREALVYLAHSIHGTAYLFSFIEIAGAAGRIERDLREDVPLAELREAVAELDRMCRAAAQRA